MTTFVTAFLDLQEDRSKDKSVDICFAHFKKLSESGISLVVFLSKSYASRVEPAPNIRYMFIELGDLITYKEVMSQHLDLPADRNIHHDTINFLILMNAKIEFVKIAIDMNPFESDHFAWIDFSICHVLKNTESSLKYLHMVSQSALKTPLLLFPGCWTKGMGAENIHDKVNWRFCGGFFIGDKESLKEFYGLYRESFPRYLNETKKLVWEVNVWHKLEFDGWKCTWFQADHNDSIIRIPSSTIRTVASFTTIPSRITTFCKRSIDSLLNQVDHIYLNVARFYERFQIPGLIPSFFEEEPYKSRVTVVLCDDKGPATKYLGALDKIPDNYWIFFCDDDQEYNPSLIETMWRSIDSISIYQNRFYIIQNDTSGGLIHGYVGNLGHASLYKNLPTFPLPKSALHIDDQWMSIYCFINNINIRPTGVETYNDIFKSLDNGREWIGSDSLFSLGNRNSKVIELAKEFKVKFVERGALEFSD